MFYPASNPDARGGECFAWPYLVELEPKLGRLLARAEAVVPADRFHCSAEVWYGRGPWQGRGLKPQLVALVGWSRIDYHAVLSSCTAYEVASGTLWEALPPCGVCWCVRLSDCRG